MAIANFKIRKETESSTLFTVISIIGLLTGAILILFYEYQTKPKQLLFIVILYGLLTLGAWIYAKLKSSRIFLNK
jgi:hypothetical protein